MAFFGGNSSFVVDLSEIDFSLVRSFYLKLRAITDELNPKLGFSFPKAVKETSSEQKTIKYAEIAEVETVLRFGQMKMFDFLGFLC